MQCVKIVPSVASVPHVDDQIEEDLRVLRKLSNHQSYLDENHKYNHEMRNCIIGTINEIVVYLYFHKSFITNNDIVDMLDNIYRLKKEIAIGEIALKEIDMSDYDIGVATQRSLSEYMETVSGVLIHTQCTLIDTLLAIF